MIHHRRSAADLIVPTARLLPWWHLAGGAVVGFVVLAAVRTNPWVDVAGVVYALRLTAVALAVGVVFTFDDPTEPMLACAPVGVRARRSVRLGLVAPAVVAVWGGLVWFASATPAIQDVARGVSMLPVWALSLEAAALLVVTLAAAAGSLWFSRSAAGGVVAAPAVLGLAAVLLLLPDRAAFWAPYVPAPRVGSPPSEGWLTWVAAHRRWAVLAGVAVIAMQVWSGDRSRRSRWSPRRRASAPLVVAGVEEEAV